MRILLWHWHGSWTNAFVQGGHTYLLPKILGNEEWGAGRGGWDWPATLEVAPEELAENDVDVVVLQRPEELDLTEQWLRQRPGRDVPAVFLQHNTPRGDVPNSRHPVADRSDVPIVHVTHFNEWMWDNGRAPTFVIEHGIVEPATRYTGELAHAAVVIQDAVNRWRFPGTDLLGCFASAAPVDVFGADLEGLGFRVGTERVKPMGELPLRSLHQELARRRVYVHPNRWTSLGLSLIEAMQIGMPVVCLAATEAIEAVPPEAGVLSTQLDVLVTGLRELVAEPARATAMGAAARDYALARYGLARFLTDWEQLLKDLTR